MRIKICLIVVSLFLAATNLAAGDAHYFQSSCSHGECGPRPNWLFSADALILGRHDGVGGDFLFNSVTGAPLLTLEDLDNGAKGGIRLGLTFFENDCYATEFSYFKMERFGGTETRETPDLITFPFFGGVPATPESRYDVDYRSLFHGFEVNRHRVLTPRISGIAGLRVIELRERFDIESPTGDFQSGIDNDLYGFQLGGQIRMCEIGCARFVTALKSGIYYNNADIYGEAVNPTTGAPMVFVDDEDEVAFVGELTMGMLIPMGPAANFRAGYQMYYLDGIGLAPHQNDDYSIFTGSGSIDQTDVWFHGGYLGVEIFW